MNGTFFVGTLRLEYEYHFVPAGVKEGRMHDAGKMFWDAMGVFIPLAKYMLAMVMAAGFAVLLFRFVLPQHPRGSEHPRRRMSFKKHWAIGRERF